MQWFYTGSMLLDLKYESSVHGRHRATVRCQLRALTYLPHARASVECLAHGREIGSGLYLTGPAVRDRSRDDVLPTCYASAGRLVPPLAIAPLAARVVYRFRWW